MMTKMYSSKYKHDSLKMELYNPLIPVLLHRNITAQLHLCVIFLYNRALVRLINITEQHKNVNIKFESYLNPSVTPI